ncbi:hypothetical protein PICMEDRAFT_17852 [Pichia membranifaciens NRRL Y-2026]|uniref:Uncharacterized protein n=1 Tax=Pichia membranifaciens NRRL Y-2026 TaxID=763406 RepID=A0A1E3NGX5_9ASCO|nr:hypothetical protein PICMEDRAFT_17852 [Pichia membranifaciens NRRL Y-2026]ODQ45381.1 hypothetical protein PICMEDRAFT_17852 [Pichia membranifaciens NRRL Y-2026]
MCHVPALKYSKVSFCWRQLGASGVRMKMLRRLVKFLLIFFFIFSFLFSVFQKVQSL